MAQKKFGRFYNHKKEKISWHFADVLQVFFKTKLNKNAYYPSDFSLDDWLVKDVRPNLKSLQPIITWIGHSSFLLQIKGINILIDPVFYDLSKIYPRNFASGILPENLPPIDVVLISHNHRDHLDLRSLDCLKRLNPVILAPLKTSSILKKNGFKKIIEFKWWQIEEMGFEKEVVQFCFLPAVHWTSRSLLDLNTSLWGSWIIKSKDFMVYFAGDSAYSDHYKQIAARFPKIDVALMPIAPNNPRKYTKNVHMNVEESIQAFIDLNAKSMIPMHWGTFRLGEDSFEEPILRLKQCWEVKKEELRDKILHIPKFGEQILFKN